MSRNIWIMTRELRVIIGYDILCIIFRWMMITVPFPIWDCFIYSYLCVSLRFFFFLYLFSLILLHFIVIGKAFGISFPSKLVFVFFFTLSCIEIKYVNALVYIIFSFDLAQWICSSMNVSTSTFGFWCVLKSNCSFLVFHE